MHRVDARGEEPPDPALGAGVAWIRCWPGPTACHLRGLNAHFVQVNG